MKQLSLPDKQIHEAMTVVLPIQPELVEQYLADKTLKRAVDYYPYGIKGLAMLSFLCGADEDLFMQELGEQIFQTLSVHDHDPRQERIHRESVEKYVLGDLFFLFAGEFFRYHSALYISLFGDSEYSDVDMTHIRRPDAIALVLQP